MFFFIDNDLGLLATFFWYPDIFELINYSMYIEDTFFYSSLVVPVSKLNHEFLTFGNGMCICGTD